MGKQEGAFVQALAVGIGGIVLVLLVGVCWAVIAGGVLWFTYPQVAEPFGLPALSFWELMMLALTTRILFASAGASKKGGDS